MLALVLGLAIFALSCNKNESVGKGSQESNKRYPLKGKVVSIDKQSGTAVVDAEEIPGFMSAMAMPYTVKPASQLDQISPGDMITADVVVQDQIYWLENVTVTQHSAAPPKPAATMHFPSHGDTVPDFQLMNQDGRRISFHQYRGKVLLITFIYTRCPFPDYCPRVSSEFAKVNRQLKDNKLSGKIHLLSISFDPINDNPAVLREYGFSCGGTHDAKLFHQWEFAVASATELPKLADFFGLTYQEDNGLITHSLSTAVITPDGKIAYWYHGNEWQAANLLKDAEEVLGITG